MALDSKTLAFVAIGVSVAANCRSSLENHVNDAIQAGATLFEIRDAVRKAEKVRQEIENTIKKIREELQNE
jgi:AhpD family alkylhydroperoxidase